MNIPFLRRKKSSESKRQVKVVTPDNDRIKREVDYERRLNNKGLQKRRSYGTRE